VFHIITLLTISIEMEALFDDIFSDSLQMMKQKLVQLKIECKRELLNEMITGFTSKPQNPPKTEEQLQYEAWIASKDVNPPPTMSDLPPELKILKIPGYVVAGRSLHVWSCDTGSGRHYIKLLSTGSIVCSNYGGKAHVYSFDQFIANHISFVGDRNLIVQSKYDQLPDNVLDLVKCIFTSYGPMSAYESGNGGFKSGSLKLGCVTEMVGLIHQTLEVLMPSVILARQASIEIREMEKRYELELQYLRGSNKSLLEKLVKK
jgi:hypothetical protein